MTYNHFKVGGFFLSLYCNGCTLDVLSSNLQIFLILCTDRGGGYS